MDRLSDLTNTLDAAQGVMDADVDALMAQARKLRRLVSGVLYWEAAESCWY